MIWEPVPRKRTGKGPKYKKQKGGGFPLFSFWDRETMGVKKTLMEVRVGRKRGKLVRKCSHSDPKKKRVRN